MEATGIDPGNFTTENEVAALLKTGLVELVEAKEKDLMIGDILASKKKGHTAVVVRGKCPDEKKVTYYPKYEGMSTSIVTALASVGERDTSREHRKKIAEANDIKDYIGLAIQNITLLNLLKNGKLIKA